jgi:glycosyltransferase involved in cell wall biosynthesis
VVLHVGRFAEQKNHLGVLAVFRGVLREVPAARLLLVGDGLLRPLVEDRIKGEGLGHAVRLLGVRGDVSYLMKQSDVFLFPSLHEGFGVVALEANAAGLPVVGSRIPGLLEAVVPEETALLHEVADLDSLTASVVRLLRDPGLSRRLAQAGRDRARRLFSQQASAARLRECYATVLSRPHGGAAPARRSVVSRSGF